mgnify:CR=1 FL=1
MKEEEAKALMVLAGIQTTNLHEVVNPYWPRTPEYDEERRNNPWWLALTPFGPILLGWRKRVIYITWKHTQYRGKITEDQVTMDDKMVHAWNYSDALTYLTTLRKKLELIGPDAQEQTQNSKGL